MNKLFSCSISKLTKIIEIVFYVLSVVFIVVGLFTLVAGITLSDGVAAVCGLAILILGPIFTYIFSLFYMVLVGGFADLKRIANAQEYRAQNCCSCGDDCDCDENCNSADGCDCDCDSNANKDGSNN